MTDVEQISLQIKQEKCRGTKGKGLERDITVQRVQEVINKVYC
jgi:hypothetical protein